VTASTQWLFEHGTSRPIAFAPHGADNWFTFDGRPWAVRRGAWLWPVDGGPPMGRYVGRWLYAATAAPLLYLGPPVQP
jgi:hypothetical protein